VFGQPSVFAERRVSRWQECQFRLILFGEAFLRRVLIER
jgi:hypothetical protein